MSRRARFILLSNVLGTLAVLGMIEAGGQVIAYLRPAYDVVFLEPDEHLGWKQVPKLRWIWAGSHWFAVDFSVDVATNSEGFRDLERTRHKPDGVQRIALLGDSLIEAVQVPFEKTAGKLLEDRLNAASGSDKGNSAKYEVLNFAISNYSVGQYLLAWEQHASRYDPTYVFILVTGLHLQRTVGKYEAGAFASTRKKRLWIRPTFRMEEGTLVREPARDFQAFVEVQERLIRTEFDGKRMRRRRQSVGFFTAELWRLAKGWNRRAPQASGVLPSRPVDTELLRLNLEIMKELGRAVRTTGGRLVVLDASRYFDSRKIRLEKALKSFCAEQQLGYIPVSQALLRANQNGRPTRWSLDAHFNEAGNDILADAMYQWMLRWSDHPGSVRSAIPKERSGTTRNS